MAKATPATAALDKAKVAYTLHEYDYDPEAARIGLQAAEALGIEPARLIENADGARPATRWSACWCRPTARSI